MLLKKEMRNKGVSADEIVRMLLKGVHTAKKNSSVNQIQQKRILHRVCTPKSITIIKIDVA